MVMDYGMSRLGRVNFREANRSPFFIPAWRCRAMQHHSEQTAREIDQEVKRIIDEGAGADAAHPGNAPGGAGGH